MSTIDLGDNPVGSAPTEAQKTQLRSSIGLGITDTVEFGEIATSQLNFPNLSTSEINAVTTATEGDTYFDSDRGQFIRFVSSSSYDVISTISNAKEDSLSTSSGVSLADSKLFKSGIVAPSADVFNPSAQVIIYDNDLFSDASGTAYMYHSGEQGPAGWYEADDVNAGIITSPVVVPNRTIRVKEGDNSFAFQFKNIVTSDTSNNDLVSVDLLGGSEYRIKLDVFVADLEEGNLNINLGYTGLYNPSTIQLTCNDLKNKTQILFLTGKLNENDNINLISTSQAGVLSPVLGSYSFTLVVKPSSSGTFNLSVNQLVSSNNPLLIGGAATIFTKLI